MVRNLKATHHSPPLDQAPPSLAMRQQPSTNPKVYAELLCRGYHIQGSLQEPPHTECDDPMVPLLVAMYDPR
jgi:hypothetical protein